MFVESRKYDGSLRSSSKHAYVVRTSRSVDLFSSPGTPFFYHVSNEERYNENGLIELYLPGKWFNVMHIFEHISHQCAMYINLAMPPEIETDRLSWVDMDLDYRVDLDGSIELVDEEEFQAHAELWRYPDDLQQQIRAEAKKLPALIEAGNFPFNYETQQERYRQWKATGLLPPAD
ncbi:MAG: DUF402 domain-containing protein [Bacteroidota bacterium]